MATYDQIYVIVFSENEKQSRLHFNLFKLMMGDKINKFICNKSQKLIETDKFRFKFFTKLYNSRGNKAHYVLNLTQDEEFHNCVAIPVTSIHSYLKEDEKWSVLFEGLK